MVILSLECGSCGKLLDELGGYAISNGSVACAFYSRDSVVSEEHGSSALDTLALLF
jgi:hypothetical protein